MTRISINLLPKEFTEQQVKSSKFYQIQAVGVVIILVLIFLSSLTIALRILQSNNLKTVQVQVTAAEERISGLKGREASLLILKNRLNAIDKYLGVPSKQASILRQITEQLPSTFVITSMSVSRLGEVSILGLVPDSAILDQITSLTTYQVSIESLNRSRDGVYRIGLKIISK